MGSRFLSKGEAAKILGCHVRTVFKLIERGELRPYAQGHLVGVSEEDVIALRDSKLKRVEERRLPFAINRQAMLRLHTEVRVLRQELDQVLRVLNIRREPLVLSDLEAEALYKTAHEYATEGWPPQIEEMWASHFLRLQVTHFNQIQHITKDRHPWRPFMKLASTMVLQPYNTELVIQLSSGREHLQSMVSVWFEVNQFSLRQLDAMFNREAKPNKRLLGILARRQQKLTAKVEGVTA